MKKVLAISVALFGLLTSCGLHAPEDALSIDMLPLDLDTDHVLNGIDNCPMLYNPGQGDLDFDGTGDACDITIDYVYNSQSAISAMNLISKD